MSDWVNEHTELVVFLGVVGTALVILALLIVADNTAYQHQTEQFINECQQVIEVSAQKCQLLWDWRQSR